ncbi:MAG: 4Fe-4S dicluster domain-containing protein [Candidatus Njordarchaeales archaeon]
MKLGIYSFGGCEGCRYRLVEDILSISAELGIELAYEPLVGLKEEQDKYDIVLVEGAIASAEDIEKLRDIRNRTSILVALGSCASLGGIPGLRRFANENAVEGVYGGVKLPKTATKAAPLSKYVKVDYMIRGCPPTSEEFRRILSQIVSTPWFKQGERRLRFCREETLDLKGRAILLQGDKCIVCGRCVKVCESMGINAIDLAYRSIETMVVTPFRMKLDNSSCISCGQCTLYCPVGALTERNDVDIVQDMLRKGDPLDAYIEPESLAALCEYLNCSIQTVIGGLKELGFNKVFIWRPGHQLEGKEKAILPASEAEYLFVEKFYPNLAKYLIDPPKLVADNGIIITQCTARKLSSEKSVLLTREVIRMLVSLGFEDIRPMELDGVLDEASNKVDVAVGPEAVRSVLDETLKKGEVGSIRICICPGGCINGGGQPYAEEGFLERVKKKLLEIESKYFKT